MAPSRPDLPKKLAARVRGAQVRVTDLRDTLIRHHKRRIGAPGDDVHHQATFRFSKTLLNLSR